MAHIEPMGAEALENMFEGLKALTSDIDGVAQKCLDEASPSGEKAYKAALAGTPLPRRVSTSVNTLKAKKNHLGDFTVSRPVGSDPKTGARYAMLAAIWHYGTHNGRIPATGWHDKAVAAAEVPVTQIVNETFEKEVRRLTE